MQNLLPQRILPFCLHSVITFTVRTESKLPFPHQSLIDIDTTASP